MTTYFRFDEGGISVSDDNPLPVDLTVQVNALSVADGADVALGATTDAAYTDTTGATAGTVVGALKGLFKLIAARFPSSLGAKVASGSLSITDPLYKYIVIPASQTGVVLGNPGAVGDYLSHIIICPATTSAGLVTVLDDGTPIYPYVSSTLADLRPITVPIGAASSDGSWSVTTGANVSVVAVGSFFYD